MFTYEYGNGYAWRIGTFYAPWRRFHQCKAATLDSSDAHALVSYGSYIALLRDYNGFSQIFLSDMYNYSPTTMRQLGRWLQERPRGNVCYLDIRDAMRRIEKNRTFKFTDYERGYEVIPVENLVPHLENEFGRNATNFRIDRC